MYKMSSFLNINIFIGHANSKETFHLCCKHYASITFECWMNILKQIVSSSTVKRLITINRIQN